MRVRVEHKLEEILRVGRFNLVDERGRVYTVESNRRLEFSITRANASLVRVSAPSRGGWLQWAFPAQLEVFLDGMHGGQIRRARFNPFGRDTLVLNGDRYTLPHRMEREIGGLDASVSWHKLGTMPAISVSDEDDLTVALVILAYIYVRAWVVED